MSILNKKVVNVLIVDDHPLTVRGYELLLKQSQENFIFETSGAFDCDEVIMKTRKNISNPYDLALLDLKIPASRDKAYNDGEDLYYFLRKEFPMTKVIIHSSITNQERISNLVAQMKPDGFLIKSDIEPSVLIEAVNAVLQNNIYYSKRIDRLLRRQENLPFHCDALDRKILYYLSLGVKMKNLPNYIPLSIASIERKTRRLKFALGVPDATKRELLSAARKQGLL